MKLVGLLYIFLFAVRVDWLKPKAKGSTLSDQELINAYRAQGEAKYLLEFLSRHRDLIVVRTLNYLRNEDETEDFIGGLYMKLAESLKKEQTIENHKAWLRRTITNSLIDQSRRNKLKDTYAQQYQEPILENPFSSLSEPDRALARKAIEKLKPLPRMYIIKHFFEGKQNKEIVEETGLKMTQVRGARDRAMTALKASLGTIFEDFFTD